MPAETINQLLLITTDASQVGELAERLTRDGFQLTLINNSGFFDEAAVSLLIGLNSARLTRR
jgi:uncharacterized protein YaaQ